METEIIPHSKGKRKEKTDKNAVVELTREWLYKENKWLWEENSKLKEGIKRLEFDVDAWHQLKLLLEWEIEKLKETIKDHQLYEEKLEHRIIEFEELLHWE